MKVVCVLKSGGDFDTMDVVNLKVMLDKNISIPYDFYCLTDLVGINWPAGTLDIMPLVYDYKGWWSKIELFRPGLIDSERIVYFDLDTIILDNIDDLLVREENFIGLQTFIPGKRWRNYLGSGILSWKNDGSFNFLFEEFEYGKHPRALRGDQDYISSKLKQHSIEFHYWQDLVGGMYSYKRNVRHYGLPVDARIVCFHGVPRPHEVTADWIQNAIA